MIQFNETSTVTVDLQLATLIAELLQHSVIICYSIKAIWSARFNGVLNATCIYKPCLLHSLLHVQQKLACNRKRVQQRKSFCDDSIGTLISCSLPLAIGGITNAVGGCLYQKSVTLDLLTSWSETTWLWFDIVLKPWLYWNHLPMVAAVNETRSTVQYVVV